MSESSAAAVECAVHVPPVQEKGEPLEGDREAVAGAVRLSHLTVEIRPISVA